MATRRVSTAFFVALWICALCRTSDAQLIEIHTDHPDAIYRSGERIVWHLKLSDGAAEDFKAEYLIKRDGLTEIARGSVEFASGAARIDSKLDVPGSLLLDVAPASDTQPKVHFLDGVVVAPKEIKPSLPPPDDFDGFWKSKLAELNAVPMEVKLEPQDSGDANIEYSKIVLRSIRGTHIYGQLARPKKAGRFPAVLIVQWAGVYPLAKGTVIDRARQGFITFNISAHDVPSNEGEDYYTALSQTTLKDYVAIGQTDRESSYFLRMYLSCSRAADYLASRDDWDHKTLVATGTSQGGLQAIVTAALNPKVTAVIANVPAGCDVTGHVIGRAFGWPYWHGRAKGDDAEKITQTSRYFDVANFSPRLKCPTLISAGLIDATCPVSGVLAAYNMIKAPKEILLMIDADHPGKNNTHAPFTKRSREWFNAIVNGQKIPPTEK